MLYHELVQSEAQFISPRRLEIVIKEEPCSPNAVSSPDQPFPLGRGGKGASIGSLDGEIDIEDVWRLQRRRPVGRGAHVCGGEWQVNVRGAASHSRLMHPGYSPFIMDGEKGGGALHGEHGEEGLSHCRDCTLQIMMMMMKKDVKTIPLMKIMMMMMTTTIMLMLKSRSAAAAEGRKPLEGRQAPLPPGSLHLEKGIKPSQGGGEGSGGDEGGGKAEDLDGDHGRSESHGGVLVRGQH